mgnify:CR=1 FL=1
MLRSALLLPLALLGLSPCAGADAAVDELLAAFQARLEQGDGIDELCERLEDTGTATLKGLNAELGKAWPQVRDRYLSALEESTRKGRAGDHRRRVNELRDDFMRVYGMGEGAMKPELKRTSKPAIDELRRLLSPTADELVSAGPPELNSLRRAARMLARFRDAALDAEYSSTPSDSASDLGTREAEIARKAGDLPREGMRILEKNREIAEKEEVPEEEARGVEECNLWRLYVGLNALVLDPKLCEAARDHSKDMKEQGFFAHESPVPGKKTPWDRAGNFGTTSSGENIYMGSPDPHAANLGWFYSPGHHKNMFNPGQKRIGLGRHGGHWTQMFGR